MGGERIVTLTGKTHPLHQKQRENVLVSFVLLKASVAEVHEYYIYKTNEHE